MQNLEAVAKEEGIAMAEHTFTTNSKDALLLSEAAKEQGREKFYDLHEKLFAAFFVDGRNIGDRNILRELAADSGIDKEAIESAWQDEKYQQRIQSSYNAARQHEIQAVPSFIFGERKLTGVVTEDVMRSAASDMVKSTSG
jgi:predicted DsbA family dithiol-disulfide isomerase